MASVDSTAGGHHRLAQLTFADMLEYMAVVYSAVLVQNAKRKDTKQIPLPSLISAT